MISCKTEGVVAANETSEVVAAFEHVEAEVNAGKWAAGFVSYEAAPAFDAALTVVPQADGPAIPLLWSTV